MDRGSNLTFIRELQAELGIESRCDCDLLSLTYAPVALNCQVIAVLAKHIRKKWKYVRAAVNGVCPWSSPFGRRSQSLPNWLVRKILKINCPSFVITAPKKKRKNLLPFILGNGWQRLKSLFDKQPWTASKCWSVMVVCSAWEVLHNGIKMKNPHMYSD